MIVPLKPLALAFCTLFQWRKTLDMNISLLRKVWAMLPVMELTVEVPMYYDRREGDMKSHYRNREEWRTVYVKNKISVGFSHFYIF